MRLAADRWRRKSGHRSLNRNLALSNAIDSKAEGLEGHRAEQGWRRRFAEDYERRSVAAIVDKVRAANAIQTPSAISKNGEVFIKVRDSQGIKKIRWELAVRCPRVH